MATVNRSPNVPKPNEPKNIFLARAVKNLMANGQSQTQATKTANVIWENYSIQQSQNTQLRSTPTANITNINHSVALPPLRATLSPSSSATNSTPMSSPSPSSRPNQNPQSGPMPVMKLPSDNRGHGKQQYQDKEFERYQKVNQRATNITTNKASTAAMYAMMPYYMFGKNLPWHQLYTGGFEKGSLSKGINQNFEKLYNKTGLQKTGLVSEYATKSVPTTDALEAQKILREERITLNLIKKMNLNRRASATEAVSEKTGGMHMGDMPLYSAGKKLSGALGTGAEAANMILPTALQMYPGLLASISAGRRANEQVHFRRNAADYGTAGKLHRGLNTFNMTRGMVAGPLTAAMPFGLTGGMGFTGMLKGGAGALGMSTSAAASVGLGAALIPILATMVTKHFAMKHKMKTRGVRSEGDNKKFDNLPGIDSALQAATQGPQPISAYESLSLSLLRAIQLNTGSLADTNAILHHYMENAANKDVPTSQDHYDDYITNSSDRKYKGFKYAAGNVFNSIEGGLLKASQKYNPLHQLGTFLLQGKTPRSEREMLDEEFGSRKLAKLRNEWVEKESKRTGMSHSALTLMTTPGTQIASYAESPQGKMTNLLTGIFDILRYNLRVNTNIAVQGFGITQLDNVPKHSSKKLGFLHAIPGVSSLINLVSLLGKGAVGIYKGYRFLHDLPEQFSRGAVKLGSKGLNLIKNLMSGPAHKYSQDPTELVNKALGSKGLDVSQIKEKTLTDILPNKLGEITGLQKSQLDVLYNIWEINRDTLKAISGYDKQYQSKIDTSQEILDKFTGEMVTSSEMKKRVKEREKKIRDTLNKDLRVSIFQNMISKMMKRRHKGSVSDQLYHHAHQADRYLSRMRLGGMRGLDSIEDSYLGGRQNLNEYELVQAALGSTIDPEGTNQELGRYRKHRDHLRGKINDPRNRITSTGLFQNLIRRKKEMTREGMGTYRMPYLQTDKFYNIPGGNLTPSFSDSSLQSSTLKVEIAGITKDFHAYKCLPIEFCSKETKMSSGSGNLPVNPDERDKYHGKNKIDTIGHELKQLDEKRRMTKDSQYKDKQIALLTKIANKENTTVINPKNEENKNSFFDNVLGFFGSLVGIMTPLFKFLGLVGTVGAGISLANSKIGDFIKLTSSLTQGIVGASQSVATTLTKFGHDKLVKLGEKGDDLISSGKAKVSKFIDSSSDIITSIKSGVAGSLDDVKNSKIGQGLLKGYEAAIDMGKSLANKTSDLSDWAKNKMTSMGDFVAKCKASIGSKIEAALTPLKSLIDSIKSSKTAQLAMVGLKKIGDVLFKIFQWIDEFKIGPFGAGKWFLRAFFIAPVIKDAYDFWKSLDSNDSSFVTMLHSLSLIGSIATIPAVATILGSISFGTIPFILVAVGMLAEYWAEKISKNEIPISDEEKAKLEQNKKELDALKTDLSKNESLINTGMSFIPETTSMPSPQGPPAKENIIQKNEQYMNTGMSFIPETSTIKPSDSGGSPSPADSSSNYKQNNIKTESSLDLINNDTAQLVRFSTMMYSSLYKIQVIKEWEQDRWRKIDEREAIENKYKPGGILSGFGSLFSGKGSSGSSGSSGSGGVMDFIKDAGKNIKRRLGFTEPTIIDPNDLSALSAISESGNRSDVVGFDNSGGASYGKYQIATKTGTMKEFLKYVKDKNPDVYNRLSQVSSSMYDKNGQFAQTWKELASEGKIQDLEKGFIKDTHYNVSYQKLDNDLAKMVDSDKTLQQIMWSMSTAFGPSGGADHFNKYYRELSKEGPVDKRQLIEKLYGGAMNRYDPNKLSGSWQGLQNRWNDREVSAALANYDKRQEETDSQTMSSSLSGPNGFMFPGPVQTITSPMGPRNVENGSRNHKGIDLRGAIGDPVRAMLDGEVLASKNGWLSIKQSDGMIANYAHMPDANLKPGDKIKAGQQLSVIGNVGTDAPHLHLEIKDDQGHINPDDYFRNKMGDSYTPKYAYADAEKRNQLASKIGGRIVQSPNQVASAVQKDAISGSMGEDQIVSSEFKGFAEILSNSINDMNSNIVSSLHDIKTDFGKLTSLSNDYQNMQPFNQIKEKEEARKQEIKESSAPAPIAVPVPGPAIIANPNRNHMSNNAIKERTYDPVSQNIIEQLFANTIVSFQQSVKNFALGQNPFTVFR